jgi:hypothetical protein
MAGRPRVDLEPVRDHITGLWEAGATRDTILDILNTDVLPTQDISPISLSTLKRALQEWGLQRYSRVEVSDALIDRIRHYFFKYGYNDSSILRDCRRDGFQLTPYSLKLIRWENGMKRRYMSEEERNEAFTAAIAFLEKDLKRTTAIKGFGRGYLYHYVRIKGSLLVSQHRLYNFYRGQFPKEVYHRRLGGLHHRTEFIVPGPNFLWSLDGYEKLKNFGFQVTSSSPLISTRS